MKTFSELPLCAVLRENLAVNDCWNVDVHEEALGSAPGTAYLPAIDYSMPNNFGGMELRTNGVLEAKVIALDSLQLPACHLLMLDIEGFELLALQGARETIMRHRPFLYIEIDREEAREAVLHYMKDELKYELLYHTPTVFNPDNYAGEKKNEFGDMCSVMCLGVPV